MTNEQYLVASYFTAAACGTALAGLTAALLGSAHRRAVAGAAVAAVGRLLRRVFPTWLILAVLLGFASVGYLDCTHENYTEVVADRGHLVATSRQHASKMLYWLAGGLTSYAVVLAGVLGIIHRRPEAKWPDGT